MKNTAFFDVHETVPAPRVQAQELVHQRIARQAILFPESVAVQSAGASVTWQELECRSNQLARHLQSLGVGLEDPVALYFERSPEFIIAALAVWKAGGAYVPLDPSYPPERVDSVLQDAAVPVLLSHKWMAAGLRSGAWTVVDLDIDASRLRGYSGETMEQDHVSGTNLAYLIYTSGSTGKPKGVQVTHANLAHLIGWHQKAFEVMPGDRASQVAGLAFDAAVWEMWCHLGAGASLSLVDEESRRSPEGLRDWLVREQITIAFVPTVMAEHLITLDWPAETRLRTLLTGADTLHRYPGAALPFTLVNNYGPTECTVLVTSGTVTPAANSGGALEQLPSIGRPIEDTEILLLDSGLQPVPAGEAGEICVAGLQVARGYHNAPELTAEKFVPYKNAAGGRIYRTGDLGKRLPSGEIAFLGRIDDQIKIRGFRVEPDDIVAQLLGLPDIRSAVVVAAGEAGDSKHLAAYLVLRAGSALRASAIREFLAGRLPDYMIPASFVKLESLPLTTTGKCDKNALPPLSQENTLPENTVEDAAAKVAAVSETEQRISQMVKALMGGREIGRDDNFFLVGGHSMLAAQLVARVRESFGLGLTLRQLFEAPTIAALAVAVERRLAGPGK